MDTYLSVAAAAVAPSSCSSHCTAPMFSTSLSPDLQGEKYRKDTHTKVLQHLRSVQVHNKILCHPIHSSIQLGGHSTRIRSLTLVR